ncbi:MAG: response regulator transcription factor [Clostridiales Family XIII bacterium]|nr:response regulator transcription factor [Clostridiales Family XIII bacterium]
MQADKTKKNQHPNSAYTILICDDDDDILAALRIYLTGEGYNVTEAHDGAEALDIVRREQGNLHLILLDVMMPVMDGVHAAIQIRTFSNVPIIFLSAKGEEADRVLGLHIGGDDYIVKPFTPIELFARTKSAIRRYADLGGLPSSGEDGADAAEPGVFQTGGLMLDDNKKLVTVDGEPVTLTALEFGILKLLIASPDRVFSSAQIYEAVRQEPAYDVSRIISVHVRHIREKIEANPKEPRYLKLVYGLGYKVPSLP